MGPVSAVFKRENRKLKEQNAFLKDQMENKEKETYPDGMYHNYQIPITENTVNNEEDSPADTLRYVIWAKLV